MRKENKINKTTIFFLMVICLLIVSRFILIDRFPPGLVHDEIEYLFSSKTYQLFGTDLSGIRFPLSLIKTGTLGQISAIPPLLISTIWSFLPINIMTARIPYVILNVVTGLILILISYLLFRKQIVAYLSGILFLLNPWSFYLSRFSADAAFALFFFLLSLTFFLYLDKWRLLIPLLVLIFGFFSYHGAKIIFLPILFICIFNKQLTKPEKKSSLTYFLIFFLALFLFVGFFLLSAKIPGSISTNRSGEIVFLNKDVIANQVDTERRQAIFFPLKNLFINKATKASQVFISKYLTAFNSTVLFLNGEYLLGHGLFYLLDLPFIIIGVFTVFKKSKKEMIFLLSLLLIAPLPTAISLHGESLTNRSFLLLPILIIFSAYGLYGFFGWLKMKTQVSGNLLALLISVVYFGFFSRFLFLYFYQLPVSAQESYMVSSRILAKYLLEEKKRSKNIVVITKGPRQQYLETVFYMNPKEQEKRLEEKKQNILKDSYTIDNIVFTESCTDVFNVNTVYIYNFVLKSCLPSAKIKYLITDQKDAGTVFKIYNGRSCDHISNVRWKGEYLLSDYKIEQMDYPIFCRRWIFIPDINENNIN